MSMVWRLREGYAVSTDVLIPRGATHTQPDGDSQIRGANFVGIVDPAAEFICKFYKAFHPN